MIPEAHSPASAVTEAAAPSAEGMENNAWRNQSKSGTSVEEGVNSSARDDGTKSSTPELAKAPKSHPPSPKVIG